MTRYTVQVILDEARNPLTGSITRYERLRWTGCLVMPAEPFESWSNLVDRMWVQWEWAYGEQQTLFELELTPASPSVLSRMGAGSSGQ